MRRGCWVVPEREIAPRAVLERRTELVARELAPAPWVAFGQKVEQAVQAMPARQDSKLMSEQGWALAELKKAVALFRAGYRSAISTEIIVGVAFDTYEGASAVLRSVVDGAGAV